MGKGKGRRRPLTQDRTGSDYEKLIAASLDKLGYQREIAEAANYLQPRPRARVVIEGTYIQPDFVVRIKEQPQAVLYSTHWSNTRSSKYKYWRTWEEQAQQKLVVGNELLSVNCVFEALSPASSPLLVEMASELPADLERPHRPPIQLRGWDPGIGWALIEAFDVTLLFPVGYHPVSAVASYSVGQHDATTTQLLKQALNRPHKRYLDSQWNCLRRLRQSAIHNLGPLADTRSRYRIGLLHLYLVYRMIQRISDDGVVHLADLVRDMILIGDGSVRLDRVSSLGTFRGVDRAQVYAMLLTLGQVHVRKGNNAKSLLTLSGLSFDRSPAAAGTRRVSFNDDLRDCLRDLALHMGQKGFVASVERAFGRFDAGYGVPEAIDDLASVTLVQRKEEFVRSNFERFLQKHDVDRLFESLLALSDPNERSRAAVSVHIANWVFEMVLYLAGLNSAEDVQTRFKEQFEASGHKLRPHAPYGGHAQTVAFMLQGRDLCEQWSSAGQRRTLTPPEFHRLAWRAAAAAIVQAMVARGQRPVAKSEVVARRYLENKAMRIISSDLNGFEIMVDHRLGDLCQFVFDDAAAEWNCATSDGVHHPGTLADRIQRSWQTDIVDAMWGGRPLETWMEGVSNDGRWLIKIQSSQDGNEGHKTKELAGRCRALRLRWTHGADPTDRSGWHFGRRPVKQLALILDGDWSADQKRNLYEAGWTWIGDISQLEELRQLIATGL